MRFDLTGIELVLYMGWLARGSVLGRGSGTQRGENRVVWGRGAKEEGIEAAGLANVKPAAGS